MRRFFSPNAKNELLCQTHSSQRAPLPNESTLTAQGCTSFIKHKESLKEVSGSEKVVLKLSRVAYNEKVFIVFIAKM